MGTPDPQNNDSHAVSALRRALRERRRELGLRQVDLADLADVSPRLVETVEQGVGSPRLDSVLALCRALGLELVVRPGTGVLLVQEER